MGNWSKLLAFVILIVTVFLMVKILFSPSLEGYWMRAEDMEMLYEEDTLN